MEVPKHVERTFKQGEKAYLRKQPPCMCPYSQFTQKDLYDIWLAGYDAMFKIQQGIAHDKMRKAQADSGMNLKTT